MLSWTSFSEFVSLYEVRHFVDIKLIIENIIVNKCNVVSLHFSLWICHFPSQNENGERASSTTSSTSSSPRTTVSFFNSFTVLQLLILHSLTLLLSIYISNPSDPFIFFNFFLFLASTDSHNLGTFHFFLPIFQLIQLISLLPSHSCSQILNSLFTS